MNDKLQNNNLYNRIVELLKSARSSVIQNVNKTMVITYYEIGRMIVEKEQQGDDKAEYGKGLIKELSKKLTDKFGKGFSTTNIKQMRSFYLAYPKGQTVSDDFNLSWSHYLKLMRIDDENERKFYEIEAVKNRWSVRELDRQFDTDLYTRLLLSKDKITVKELSEKGLILEKPSDIIKDPYVLEFIGLPENTTYSESELEQKIIDKLEYFLLELGTGFTFVGRQKRITSGIEHFYIDLVFYNRLLQCFVLIDLKIGKLKHQDIGQMQMYVNYYDREVKTEFEKPTIGLILCKEKNDFVIKYTLPENNEQIFASKYQTVLPSKKELKELLDEQDDK